MTQWECQGHSGNIIVNICQYNKHIKSGVFIWQFIQIQWGFILGGWDSIFWNNRPFGDDSPVIILGHGEDSFGWLRNCWKIFRKNRKLLVLPNRKLLVLPFKPGPLFFPNSGRACLPWNLWTKYELGSSFEKENICNGQPEQLWVVFCTHLQVYFARINPWDVACSKLNESIGLEILFNV